MSTTVQARTLQGMHDWFGQRARLKQWVIGELRQTFELFGFEPLDTPAVEYADTLRGKYGEEADKLIYQFEDRGGRAVGLRYDLTVPLARVVAQYPDLPRPFKRYHIAPVWRAERPQKGRYREFTQCDVDIAGSASPLADAEIVAVLGAGFDRLGFPGYAVRLNNRKLLAGLAGWLDVSGERTLALFRTLDKLDKIGWDGVLAELRERGFEERTGAELRALFERSDRPQSSHDDGRRLLRALEEEFGDRPLALEGIAELRQVLEAIEPLGVRAGTCRIDLSMTRGLDYYTGPIFEVAVEEPKIGSVAGGGRYDNMIGIFLGRPVPATGGSFGFDRIIDVIEELGLQPRGLGGTVTQVFVTVFGPETTAASLGLARDLRAAGVRTEVALTGDRLPNQLRAAARRDVPFVAIVGPDELASNEVVVKDMASGEQSRLPRATVAATLAARLASRSG
ncbi:MAG TPA: histidine--tRNA ligase [Chloroflexota bacterium]|jgi:histidyl-tRNA synthetase|nr:histidine--tRNA ligase [Chloroflexota bacterium]